MPVSGFEWSEGATKTREPQTLQACRQWLGVKYSPFSLSQRLSHSHRALQPNLTLAEFQPAGKAAKGRLGTSLGLFWTGSRHLPSAQGVLWLPSGNPRQVKEMVQLWDEEAAAQMESFPTKKKKKKKKNQWLEMCLKRQEIFLKPIQYKFWIDWRSSSNRGDLLCEPSNLPSEFFFFFS